MIPSQQRKMLLSSFFFLFLKVFFIDEKCNFSTGAAFIITKKLTKNV